MVITHQPTAAVCVKVTENFQSLLQVAWVERVDPAVMAVLLNVRAVLGTYVDCQNTG